MIAGDTKLDIIAGSAGTILSLLRSYRKTQQARVLERAMLCGDHLLASYQLDANGRRYWAGVGVGVNLLTVMSHGAAGFGFAFACLAQASGREDFGLAAQDCIDNKNANFDPLNKNWYTLKENEDWRRAIKCCQWCHGAVGIGLARIGTEKLSGLHYRHTREDTERAVLATRLHLNKASDTLCCGTLGGIEFFLKQVDF